VGDTPFKSPVKNDHSKAPEVVLMAYKLPSPDPKYTTWFKVTEGEE